MRVNAPPSSPLASSVSPTGKIGKNEFAAQMKALLSGKSQTIPQLQTHYASKDAAWQDIAQRYDLTHLSISDACALREEVVRSGLMSADDACNLLPSQAWLDLTLNRKPLDQIPASNLLDSLEDSISALRWQGQFANADSCARALDFARALQARRRPETI